MTVSDSITSRQNPKILAAGKLKDRRTREQRGEFSFEGRKLFEEAVCRGVELRAVFATEKNLPFCFGLLESLPSPPPVYLVTDGVYEKLSEEKSPEGIFTVAKAIDKLQKIVTIYRRDSFSPFGEPSEKRHSPRRIILSSMQDPGNLGAVIRTAAAFGVEEVILSRNCADLYNRKTLRASMGTLFSTVVTVVSDLPASIAAIREEGVPVLAAALREDARSLLSLESEVLRKAVFVVGNEGHGLDGEILRCCNGSVIIPMTENAESLNAAAAAALLLFEQWRIRFS